MPQHKKRTKLPQVGNTLAGKYQGKQNRATITGIRKGESRTHVSVKPLKKSTAVSRRRQRVSPGIGSMDTCFGESKPRAIRKAKVMVNKKSDKFIEARETLAEELRPVFDLLVEEYYFFSTQHYGKGYVAYKVLAELVRGGWAPPDSALAEANALPSETTE